MDLGYRVVEVEDVTGSPGSAHQIGLELIHHAGGIILSAKSLYYEWVRIVAKALAFEDSGIETSGGIILLNLTGA